MTVQRASVRRAVGTWSAAALFALAGCGARDELIGCEVGHRIACESVCGVGEQVCTSGRDYGPCSASPPVDVLPLELTLRDVRASHPDFEEGVFGLDPGIVEPLLGPDGLPVYAGSPTTLTTSGAEAFESWFRDVPGVSESVPGTLPLVREGGDPPRYTFASSSYFPLDGQLFGNEGLDHNFHFTLTLRTEFRYAGGEVFSFRGDDDVFVFVGGKLVMDLGGVHGPEAASVNIDFVAADLGASPGDVLPLALFFAERHTSGSNLAIDTTIAEFKVCPEP